MNSQETLIKVRYAETDAMGFVYYANHFVYYEAARGEWMEARGFPYQALEAEGIGVPVIEAHCFYKKPAHYGDTLWIRSTARLSGSLKLRFDYETRRRDADGELIDTGWTMHVCMDRRGRPCRPPEKLLAMLDP